MKRILIATPCYGGMVASGYMLSLLKTICNNNNANIKYSIYTLGNESLITRARNKCVAYFLANNFTHLLFIDADIEFEPSIIHRVLNFDKEVVCGLYPRKGIMWNNLTNLLNTYKKLTVDEIKNEVTSFNYFRGNNMEVVNGFAKVDYAATGFMCIRREVFDKMRLSYPEQKYNPVDTEKELVDHMWLFFDCMVDEHKNYLSEDFAFCKKWRALGGEIWLDTESNLKHIGTYVFEGNTKLHFTKE
jgi:hypothetical protein